VSQTNPKTVASIEVTFLPDFAVAAIGGTLGEPYAQALREQLRAIVLGGRRYILVDLTGVAEVDSRGLGAIISLVKLARERGGAVRCCGARPNVADVFALTRLDRILDFYANQAVALAEPWDHPAAIPADS
jgi:anti-anti-sigma factor